MILRSSNIGQALRARQRGFLLNPFRFGAGGGGGSGGDANFANVSLLLHMDGTNGSTTFTDSGPLAKTMTANGNAQISTAQSVFGGAAGLFDGSGDWVSTPAFAGVDMGAGDFTAEGRLRHSNAASATEFVMGNHNSSGTTASLTFQLSRNASGKLTAGCGSGSSSVGSCVSTTTLLANVWYAFAYVRNGSNFYLFIDGTQEATASSAATLNTSVDTFSLGRSGAFNSNSLAGYLDDVRITKGVARYTGASYTLAASAFPDS